MKYGYARVSTTDQDLTIQLEALEKAGCTIIRQEKVSMLGVFAQFENDLRRERIAEGIAKAKQLGKYKGRKASVDIGAIKVLANKGLGASAIARELNIGRSSVYRALG